MADPCLRRAFFRLCHKENLRVTDRHSAASQVEVAKNEANDKAPALGSFQSKNGRKVPEVKQDSKTKKVSYSVFITSHTQHKSLVIKFVSIQKL